MPLVDAEAERVLGFMTPEQRLSAAHLALPDGRVFSGAGAVLESAALLVPLLRPLVWLVLHLPGGRLVAEKAYRFVAANRHRWSRTCRPKEPGAPPTGERKDPA